MHSIPKFKKKKKRGKEQEPQISVFKKFLFPLTRNALDSMQYFPWQQLAHLWHLRREMVPQEKKKGGKSEAERFEGFEEQRIPVSRENISRELMS